MLVRLGREGRARAAGARTLRRVRPEPGADLDLDASVEALVDARATRRPPLLEELWARAFGRPETGLCLVVDRSGSMGGHRLATAALAAAAVAYRAPEDHSVLAFANDVIVLKAQGAERPPGAVALDLLALRGHGTTDLALALRAAREELSRSPAARRVAVVLTDARATTGEDPLPAARALEELVLLAPAKDAADAAELAAAAGARLVELGGPSDVPAALAAALAPP